MRSGPRPGSIYSALLVWGTVALSALVRLGIL